MKSRLIKLAQSQRTKLSIAATLAWFVKNGIYSYRETMRLKREMKRWINEALDTEQTMFHLVMDADADIEDFSDLAKIEATQRLTLFRVNRLAYAGRVLP